MSLVVARDKLINAGQYRAASNGNELTVWDASVADFMLNITAISGSGNPAIEVEITTTDDERDLATGSLAAANWFHVQKFEKITQTGLQKITITEGLCRYARAEFTFTGSFASDEGFTLVGNMTRHFQ